jgi:integral membrane protein (TIGR01906 family)
VLLVLSATFSVLLTPAPTHVFATWFSDERYSGYTHEEMVAVADGILAYSLGDDTVVFPQGDTYQSSMDQESLAHLRDCRPLFNGVRTLAIATGAVFVILVAAMLSTHRRKMLGKVLGASAVTTLLVVVSCVTAAIVDWGAFFDWLHHFFFTGGSWYFKADSLMICAVPTRFWMAMGVLWAVLIALACIILWVIGRRLRKDPSTGRKSVRR